MFIIQNNFSIFCFQGGPRVLTNMSSSDVKANKGDLVNLLCSGQDEPPINFSCEKDQTSLESHLVEVENPYHSSLLVVTVKDGESFGKYTCQIQDRFQSTTHTILVEKLKDAGNTSLCVKIWISPSLKHKSWAKTQKHKTQNTQTLTKLKQF